MAGNKKANKLAGNSRIKELETDENSQYVLVS